jgi:hypothetical protein
MLPAEEVAEMMARAVPQVEQAPGG